MQKVNNDIYNDYGDRWYTANDDPIALLRAESKVKTPWIIAKIKEFNYLNTDTKVLDIGCGGGFLSNALAKQSLKVTGIDLSAESLKVAKAHDETNTVNYQVANAYELPFEDQSFDIKAKRFIYFSYF